MNYSNMQFQGTIKFAPNDLTHLNEVKIFDAHGNLKRVVQAVRLGDDPTVYDTKNKKYGEDVCRGCNKIFTLYKKRQYNCAECIQKRPLIGLSLRR